MEEIIQSDLLCMQMNYLFFHHAIQKLAKQKKFVFLGIVCDYRTRFKFVQVNSVEGNLTTTNEEILSTLLTLFTFGKSMNDKHPETNQQPEQLRFLR